MKLQLKRSNVIESNAAKIPTSSQLEYGELAINYNQADPAIFLKDSNNNVIRISGIGNIADDGQVELPASTTPPANPLSGNLWFNSDEGRLYIYYTDADTSQWVDASPDSWDPTVLPDTTNPAHQAGTLDDRYVNSNGDTLTGALLLDNAASAAAPDLAFDGDLNTGIYSPGADSLAITTAGTQRVTVDSSGNVGIGTSSPQANLDIRSTADAPSLTFNGSGQAIVGDSANQLAIGRDSSSPFSLYLQGRASNNVERNIALNPTGGNVSIGTTNSSIGQNSTFSVNSVNPANVLSISRQVNDSTGPRLFLTKTRGTETSSVSSGDTLGDLRFNGSDGTDVASIAASIAAQVDGTPGSNDMPGRLTFSTTADGASSPTERMRIKSNGNVGIGTSNPQTVLDVRQSADNSSSGIRLERSNGFASYTQYIDTYSQYNIGYSNPATSDPSEAYFTISFNGNVGIGTSSPQSNLHIQTSTSACTLRMADAGTTSPTYFQTVGNDLRAVVNGGERVRILSTGGLTFNGDTAAANALDDYEEGTWTGSVRSTGNLNSDIFTSSGKYTKIGRVVRVSIKLFNNNTQTAGHSGHPVIMGLPFSSSSNSQEAIVAPVAYNGYYGKFALTYDFPGSNNSLTLCNTCNINDKTSLFPNGANVRYYMSFSYTVY